ncbi:MAG: primosomal protein N' [Calditrichaeota bacterium]|nr:primosomal protein N' [Calditrichota bacterium]
MIDSLNAQGKFVRLAEVVFFDTPFGPFTYRVPLDLELESPGSRVKAPFRNRSRIGFVVDLKHGEDKPHYKAISSIIDPKPLLAFDLLELTRWMAEYYLCEWGETLAAAIPVGLKAYGRLKYRLSSVGREVAWMEQESGCAADLWRALYRLPMTLLQIKRHFKDYSDLLDGFRRRGWLETYIEEGKSDGIKYDLIWRWTNALTYAEARIKLPKRAAKLISALDLIQEMGGSALQSDLSRRQKQIGIPLRSLKVKGWLDSERIPVDRFSLSQTGLEETANDLTPVLSPAQQTVVSAVTDSLKAGIFRTHLLYGVTGSGKSLVYLEIVAKMLEMGRDVLVLVPEIALTPQLAGRLRRRFGLHIGITHSGLSNGERRDIWSAVSHGRIKVVVGPRSALFAPLKNLGLIVIDEEHDDSYKQDEPAPRYSGRDAAIKRAQICNATVLLGSATPDVVSFHNASTGRYRLLELPERHQGVHLPSVWVVKWCGQQEGSIFSPHLQTRLNKRLAAGEQTILLLNRRGFATCIRCPDCGEVAKCPNCDIILRYHRVGERLECHYCGWTQRAIDLCPLCGGQRVRYSGVGTQRVERELNIRFPQARLARMDLDTTRVGGSQQKILSGLAQRQFDILLGTQMVAKGHDFPNVTLVGVLAADLEWLEPDFRAVERAFRLLVQAAGRTGRAGAGEVIVQSLNPSHPMLRWVQAHNYEALYKYEIDSRQPLSYPPFGRLITVWLKSRDRGVVQDVAAAMRAKIDAALTNCLTLGPAAPIIERLQGQFRRRILLKLPPRLDAQARENKVRLKFIAQEIRENYSKTDIKVAIDVDPMEV